MARKKKKRQSRQITVPLAVIGGMSGSLLSGYRGYKNEGVVGAVRNFARSLTGYDVTNGKFDAEKLKIGLFPLVMGMLVHKFVGGAPLNVNKILSRAKVPFIRI